jgi:hypothetical protein
MIFDKRTRYILDNLKKEFPQVTTSQLERTVILTVGETYFDLDKREITGPVTTYTETVKGWLFTHGVIFEVEGVYQSTKKKEGMEI